MLHIYAYLLYSSFMASRQDRQKAIEQIIRSDQITGQTQLLKQLKRKGLKVDQSTLSRDLAELGIQKSGGRYVKPKPPTKSKDVDLSGVVNRVAPCGPNLIVIQTAVGQAQPVALAIDRQADASIVATLAGDDTIFVATKSRRTQTVALRRLQQWFGVEHER